MSPAIANLLYAGIVAVVVLLFLVECLSREGDGCSPVDEEFKNEE
jgi:hypothetical protein